MTSKAPEISQAQFATLAQRRIYFGHQSVGYDVMTGMQALVSGRSDTGGFRLVALKDGTSAPAGPGFMHGFNGTNEQPQTKIDGFPQALEKLMQGRADIAFYKFCYVDIRADTNVQDLFQRYKASATRLQQQYPQTTFVHMTVPLTVVQSGPKAMLKKLLGRPDRWAQDNAQRERFNDLLRREYSGAPLFDLARLESTWEDGRRHTAEAEQREIGALIDDYSTDGKHLNERGQRWVAAHLLEFLATVPMH